MNEKIEIRNAVIERTTLGTEDHGMMTFMLYLNYGGSGQGFGGYFMDEWNKELDRRIGTAWGMEVIALVLKTVGVDSWEELKGQHIRVETTFGKVLRIGHFLDDKWLDLDKDLAFLKKEKV